MVPDTVGRYLLSWYEWPSREVSIGNTQAYMAGCGSKENGYQQSMIDRDLSSRDGASLTVNRSAKCHSTLSPHTALVLKILVLMELDISLLIVVHSSQLAKVRRSAS